MFGLPSICRGSVALRPTVYVSDLFIFFDERLRHILRAFGVDERQERNFSAINVPTGKSGVEMFVAFGNRMYFIVEAAITAVNVVENLRRDQAMIKGVASFFIFS